MGLNKQYISELVKKALEEDIGSGDITTNASIDPLINVKAKIFVKENLVVCGLNIAKECFKQVDQGLKIKLYCKDGDKVKKNQALLSVQGRAKSILTAERTVLNFITSLSGIASFTRQFVEEVKKYKVKILDTRKTMPLLRRLHKYAVATGGGDNHRMGLWDGVMLKENHLIASKIRKDKEIDIYSLSNLIKNIKKVFRKPVEVEVESKREFVQVAKCRPDIVLLDNFSPLTLKDCVRIRDKHYPKIKLEASGGINLKNIANYARSGIDYISLGCLTHSFRNKDISLDII